MAKFVLEFGLANAAFRDDETGAVNMYAVADQLQKIADQIKSGKDQGSVKCANGNWVGFYRIEN